eukprot:7325170-Pyramimonas_sp.AAC.1
MAVIIRARAGAGEGDSEAGSSLDILSFWSRSTAVPPESNSRPDATVKASLPCQRRDGRHSEYAHLSVS